MRSGQFPVRASGSSSAGKRRFVAVAQRLLDSVHNGQLRAGDRLSPDRVLAAEFEVSRATVREALLALELLGVVEIRHGSGVYVADSSLASGLAAADWVTPSTTALFEARTAVEPKIARLCALRMSPEQVKRGSELISQARAVVGEKSQFADFSEVQLAFHSLLMDSCQNPILADINRHLTSVEEHPLWALLNQHVTRTQAQRMQQVAEHARILKHIKAREPDAAAAAMAAHLTDLGCALVGSDWIP